MISRLVFSHLYSSRQRGSSRSNTGHDLSSGDFQGPGTPTAHRNGSIQKTDAPYRKRMADGQSVVPTFTTWVDMLQQVSQSLVRDADYTDSGLLLFVRECLGGADAVVQNAPWAEPSRGQADSDSVRNARFAVLEPVSPT
jgi:hypothetical protein